MGNLFYSMLASRVKYGIINIMKYEKHTRVYEFIDAHTKRISQLEAEVNMKSRQVDSYILKGTALPEQAAALIIEIEKAESEIEELRGKIEGYMQHTRPTIH